MYLLIARQGATAKRKCQDINNIAYRWIFLKLILIFINCLKRIGSQCKFFNKNFMLNAYRSFIYGMMRKRHNRWKCDPKITYNKNWIRRENDRRRKWTTGKSDRIPCNLANESWGAVNLIDSVLLATRENVAHIII